MVCETTWGGNHDVWTGGEGEGLRSHLCATSYEDRFEGLRGAEGKKLFVYLKGEFSIHDCKLFLLCKPAGRVGLPCGCQDNSIDAEWIFRPSLQHWYGKCNGFARTCSATAYTVTTTEYGRYTRLLDGCGVVDLHRSEGSCEPWHDVERAKGRVAGLNLSR